MEAGSLSKKACEAYAVTRLSLACLAVDGQHQEDIMLRVCTMAGYGKPNEIRIGSAGAVTLDPVTN